MTPTVTRPAASPSSVTALTTSLTRHCPRPCSVVTLVLLLLVLLSSRDDLTVLGQRRSWRRQNSKQPGAPGPNMCKVQHVVGSSDKFYTYCVAKHLKYICERPTYSRWECCSGFTKKGRERGCKHGVPLNNLLDLSRDLKLNTFVKHVEKAMLQDDLTNHGPYTLFAPTDTAFAALPLNAVSRLHPEDGSPSQISYHVAPGRLNISTFRRKNQEFVTLHGDKKIRVNKYAYGVATVNCARITRPDELATNGVVHVVDKVISPVDVDSTLAKRIHDDERFSQFELALMVSKLGKKLKDERRSFTVLAPTNEAFSQLPGHVLDKIFTDEDTAEKILKRHIVRGVFCADAIVVSVGLKTLDDARLLFRCKRDGLWINGAKVVYPDIVTSNGVIHGINTVLLPDSVKSMTEMMQDMHLDKFMDMMVEAELNGTFHGQDYTVFAPTNKAISKLSSRYLQDVRSQPQQMAQLVLNHVVPGRMKKPDLVGDSTLVSLADVSVKIKVSVARAGVTVDKAVVGQNPRECEDAVIHRVDSVMVPPESSLVDTVLDMPDLSMFAKILVLSGVGDTLLPDGSYTLLAPTNRALTYLDKRQLASIIAHPDRLKKFAERHVIPRMVLKCSVPENGVYTLKSMQRDQTHFTYDTWKRMYVNQHARVLSDDLLTSNGVLYKIDHVLPCSCERTLRNRYGQYISGHRYRKPYS